MSKKYKLICMDMDGTLLDKDGVLSQYSESVLKRARDKGAILCLATARPLFEMIAYCVQLGIDFPVVICNGAYVYDVKNDKFWHETDLPVEEAMDILHYCKENNLFWTLMTHDTVYFPEDAKRFIDMNAQVNRYYKIVQDARDANGLPMHNRQVLYTDDQWRSVLEKGACKITVEGSPEKMAIVDRFYQSDRKYCTVSKQASNNVREITYCSADKWKGIKIVAEKLGVPDDEICTFGDNLNDLEMIRNCKTSFVMANGDERIFKYATHVVDSNINDGVAKAIEEYISDNII